jgi:hypothetical protein
MPAPLTVLPCSYRRRTLGPMPWGGGGAAVWGEKREGRGEAGR